MLNVRCTEIVPELHAAMHGADVLLKGVSIDTRSLQPGNLFIALHGQRFDGHDYVSQAVDKGAVAVLVDRPVSCQATVLQVSDTRIALGQLAYDWRRRFTIPTIAVTGSNGKTSTKEMIASILQQSGSVLATQGNLNNDIGVPLSLLRLDASHVTAVFELGANHPGEIAYTVGLVKPDVAIITNVAPAHLQGFESVEGVARAKGEIWSGLAENGVAVFDAASPYKKLWQNELKNRRVATFGEQNADYQAEHLILNEEGYAHFVLHTPNGCMDVALPLPGRHQALNALAAAAACSAIGIQLPAIVAGLQSVSATHGRAAIVKGKSGMRVIDDSYNANVGSVAAAIALLAMQKGVRILALGDLGELGEHSSQYHRELGLTAKRAGIDKMYTVGHLSALASEAFGDGSQHFDNKETLIQWLIKEASDHTTVLVKGSRSAEMDKIVMALTVGE